MTAAAPSQMTASEYLEWEARQELRYEYCDGKVFAMSGGTKNHLVSCDDRDEANDSFYEFFKLIVEVLSPSTKTIDREDKFQEYIPIPSLEEHGLISSQRMQLECYRWGEGRMWLYFPDKAGEKVSIASMGVEVPIEQLYRNVRLEPSDCGCESKAYE